MMKGVQRGYLALVLGISVVLCRADGTNMPPAVPGTPPPPAGAAPAAPRRSPAVETYVDRDGWQSGVGMRGMEHYVERLASHLQKNIPGLIAGVAGGKRGILLLATFRGQRNFYRAQENTEQFLKAIVDDLATRLPEPVAPVVTVKYQGTDIIIAERVRGEVRVRFLQ